LPSTDDDCQHTAKKVGEVVEYPPPKRNQKESGKYSGIAEKNLVGDKGSKEMAFGDNFQHTAKKVGEVVEYPPPKIIKNNPENIPVLPKRIS
jgi:hypothetical protein